MACLTTDKIYRFPDFDFLTQGEVSVTQFLDLDPQAVIGTIEGETPIHEIYFDQLLTLARRSNVGVGRQTLYNEMIRASNEISADEITLQPALIEIVQQAVSQMGLQLSHPTPLRPQLYKLLLYNEGDHFSDHIDNSHSPNMIMTLSVELPMSGPTEGGNLILQERIVFHPDPGKIGLTLFYQDVLHRVTQVKKGRRLVLVFDVIQEPVTLLPVFQPYWNSFIRGIKALRKRGVKRIGFPTNHIYLLDEAAAPHNLKGMDRIGYELFKAVAGEPNVYIEGVAESDDSYYFEAVTELLDLEGSFNVAFDKVDPHEEETEALIHKELKNEGPDRYDQIELYEDSSRSHRAIDPKYRMGDVVLLASTGRSRLTYSGNEELYTGNEGFNGEIYTHLGIFANI